MTFLNPFVLFGLAAASLPVLFHLFAQRKAKRMEFSSIQFLKKLEKSSMRKVKLRQILLLILRTLLIIALVMAFARPALQGYLGGFFGSSSANTTMVLLIDNSASMGQRSSAGQYFKQAQDAALKIASVMRDGDEVVVIPIASIDRNKEYEVLYEKGDIRTSINEVSLVDASARLDDALRIAATMLESSHNINKELYLLSDDQIRNFKLTDSTTTSDSSESIMRLFDERTRLFHVSIGGDVVGNERNLSIDSLKPITTIYEPSRPIEFEAFVRNTGSVSAENESISLFMNEERYAQRTIPTLNPGTTERIVLSGQPRGTGSVGVRAEVEEDALPFDNKRYAALTIPATRRVGLFFSNSSDADFISLALSQTITDNSGTAYSIELHRTEELRMLPSLSRLDAIIVGLNARVEASDIKALRDHISAGKAAAVFILHNTDPATFNTAVAPGLALPLILAKEGSASEMTKYSSFTQIDASHPFFSGMFENNMQGVRGIESPKIFEYYRFALSGVSLINVSSGGPFLFEQSIGRGKLLVYSVPPNLSFSDLPRKSIFLPLVRRTAAYLATLSSSVKDESSTDEFYTDASFDVELPELQSETAGSSLVVKSPSGIIRRVTTVASPAGKLRLQMTSANEAGIYNVFKDTEGRVPIASFAVNVRSREADLMRADREKVETSLAPYFIESAKAIIPLDLSKEDISKDITQSRYGVELWQSFLGLALLCAVAEMFIAREAKSHS